MLNSTQTRTCRCILCIPTRLPRMMLWSLVGWHPCFLQKSKDHTLHRNNLELVYKHWLKQAFHLWSSFHLLHKHITINLDLPKGLLQLHYKNSILQYLDCRNLVGRFLWYLHLNFSNSHCPNLYQNIFCILSLHSRPIHHPNHLNHHGIWSNLYGPQNHHNLGNLLHHHHHIFYILNDCPICFYHIFCI